MTADKAKTKLELLEEIAGLRKRLAIQEALDQSVPPSEVAPRAAAYHRVLEGAGDIIVELDKQGSVIHVSPSIESVLGYAPDETINQSHPDWIHKEDRERLLEQFSKLFASGGTATASCRLRHKAGAWKMFDITASPYLSAEKALRVVAHLKDVTASWEAEVALSEAQQRARLVDEMNRDVVLVILHENAEIIWANDALMDLLGYRFEDFSDIDNFYDKIHPSDLARVKNVWETQLINVGDTSNYEPYRFRLKDGSYKWLEGGDRVFETADGERQIVSVVRDVTKTHRMLQELRESEERYRIIDQLNHDTMLLQGDEAGRLVWANDALYHLLGLTKEDVRDDESFFARIHPDDIEAVEAVYGDGYAEVGKTFRYAPYRIMHKDGSWRWIKSVDKLYENDSGEQWSISAIRDVTAEIEAEADRRKLVEQLNENQRLESLGVMAGGIAHDFNNLLTPIVGETSLALLDLPKDSPLLRPLLKIQKAAHRAAALTHQMLAYSGQGPLLIEPIRLSELVEEMGQLLESTVSGRALLTYSCAPDLPAIEGDSSQLSQIVMNLISNATEAVEEGSGHISVRTGIVDSCDVDLEHIVGNSQLGAGPYVFLEVTDDGCGMEAEAKPKIFDPFFTTKFTGRGLGLASVVGIVRGHKGLIVLDSELGRGTRFQVLLPAVRTPAVATSGASKPRPRWHGDGTVLVIDDDEGVREFADETLRRAGLDVLLASDGAEGLTLFRENADSIRAVVLDRTMPSVGGDAVFDGIRRIRPNAAIILVSGYSEDVARSHMGKTLDAFLHKPFEPSALLDTIRRVVEAKA